MDYISVETEPVRDNWRRCFMTAMTAVREKRKVAKPDIADMVPKLKAMKILESVGNFEAASKLGRGDLPYNFVNEDGSLNHKHEINKDIDSLPL